MMARRASMMAAGQGGGGSGGSVTPSNNDFSTWGSTSQAFVYTGTWSPTSAAIPSYWTTAPTGSGPGFTAQRATYATGSGSDAGVHSGYMFQLVAVSLAGGITASQSVAIGSGAAGRSITVKAWVKGSNFTTAPTATIALGSYSTSVTVTTAWQQITLTIPSSHGLAGTNPTLAITGSSGGSMTSMSLEWASVETITW